MQNGIDKASLDQWYVLDTEVVIPVGRSQNRLLGTDLTVVKQADGTIEVVADGRAEPLPLRHRFVPRLAEVDAVRWDALRGSDDPFTSHAFLSGLEETGWLLG